MSEIGRRREIESLRVCESSEACRVALALTQIDNKGVKRALSGIYMPTDANANLPRRYRDGDLMRALRASALIRLHDNYPNNPESIGAHDYPLVYKT